MSDDIVEKLYEALKAVDDELRVAWDNRTLPASAVSKETKAQMREALAEAEKEIEHWNNFYKILADNKMFHHWAERENNT
jgi:molybdopterin-guanine dinucleotide biosynthesis protein A